MPIILGQALLKWFGQQSELFVLHLYNSDVWLDLDLYCAKVFKFADYL